MACERYREALADVAAGAPAPAGVESHLASCEACREELAARRRALSLADGEMAFLLSAQPSPDLAARIRQAAAEAEPSAGWSFGWLWPAMAAAATLLVALAVGLGRGPTLPPEPRVALEAPVIPGGSDAGARPALPPGTTNPNAARPRPSPARPSRAQGDPRVARVVTPEVLVPPGEGEALLRLVALVHRERLSPAGLAAAGQPSADLAEPLPIDIEPLEIVPLDPAETSGT